MEADKSVNPIINYLKTEQEKVVPEELFETLKPILHDPNVNDYLADVVSHCIAAIRQDANNLIPSFRMLTVSSMAVGYLYGKEDKKTPEDIVNEFFKEKGYKIKEDKVNG